MRVIKFRAWQDNQMLTQKTSGIYTTKQFLDKLYEDCELMQFTGLKDKNGKEIYEGDIIEWIEEPTNKNTFHEICWLEREGCWGTRDSIWLCNTNMNYKVIGNIYENPELIKND